MKRLVLLSAVVACLVLSAPAFADDCPMMMGGVERTVASLDNGVKVTLVAKDEATTKKVQSAMAHELAHPDADCKSCPMHAKGVAAKAENTKDGVVLLLTSSDKEQVKALQAMGASGCGKGCAHGKAAKPAAAEQGGCCDKAKAAQQASAEKSGCCDKAKSAQQASAKQGECCAKAKAAAAPAAAKEGCCAKAKAAQQASAEQGGCCAKAKAESKDRT